MLKWVCLKSFANSWLTVPTLHLKHWLPSSPLTLRIHFLLTLMTAALAMLYTGLPSPVSLGGKRPDELIVQWIQVPDTRWRDGSSLSSLFT